MKPIATDRLILRDFTLDGAAAFQRLNADPAVLRNTYDPPIESVILDPEGNRIELTA